MSKFKFTTKNGVYVNACVTDSEENAWKWISKIKVLPIEKSKELYNITEV